MKWYKSNGKTMEYKLKILHIINYIISKVYYRFININNVINYLYK